MFFVYLVICILTNQIEWSVTNETLLNVVYWEIKPFIFTNEDGEIDGIIPSILQEAEYYCMRNDSSTALVKFTRKEMSRESFYELARSNVNYGEGKLENVSRQKAIWFPVVSNKDRNSKQVEEMIDVRSFLLIKTTNIAVIVPRSYIALPNKMLRGIASCKQIFGLAFLLAAMFGMTIWFVEHFNSDHFHSSFIKGSGTGLWWSIVSMTTVGYGDVILKSSIGRFVAVLWLFIGLMIACLMTATMTDIVSGLDLKLREKTVSVLTRSYEEKVAMFEYGAKVESAKSYTHVIEMVRQGKVFGAMINADIAAWHQNEITDDNENVPLRIVKLLPANLYVNCYISKQIKERMQAIFKCMYHQQDEVYKSSVEQFRRHCQTEVLYIGSMSEFFKNSKLVQILTSVVSCMFLAGIIYDRYQKCKDQKSPKEDITQV